MATKACSTFFSNLEDFKDGLNHQSDDGDPPLCDCLQHEEISPHISSPDSDTESKYDFTMKECSGCRAVVYCSPECQRQDWEAIHRQECTKSRAERLEPRASGLRMTHQNRMFYLRNLCGVVTAVSRMEKPHEHRNCCKPEKNRAFFLDQRDMPLQWSTMEADDMLEWEADLKGDSSDVAILDNPRFRAMIDESNEYEDVHVACSIADLGEYLVATMGRFVFCDVDPERGSEPGAEAHGEFEVHLLGGAVRFVDLSNSP